MFWADRVAQQIIKSGKYKPYRVDDMKTPSGKIHVGSLRGVVIHDLIYKALLEKGEKATYTYCINDMDPMDGFPPYLDKDKFYKYMAWPLFKIPSPGKRAKCYSEYYANEFIEIFNRIDCYPEVIWTSRLYKDGKFDEIIKTCLDKAEEIRKIFRSQYEHLSAKDYFPYQPICPKCGKIATTKVYKWDGSFVYFRCIEKAVDYTNGCGYEGSVKPEGQKGKMPWKVEWAAHWKLLDVTIEWAGKDHMTEGGSYEISSRVCSQILNYPPPYANLYEHLLVGGRKMSSSKGTGVSAVEIAQILPPEILRFLLVRTHYRKTIDFNPDAMTIPDLFDEYDKFADIYYTKDQESDFDRIWQLSQITDIPENKLFLPRFRDVANYIQNPSVDIYQKFGKIKGSRLTREEKKILEKRIKYAEIWLSSYAPEEYVYKPTEEISGKATNLSGKQRNYLQKIGALLLERGWNPDDLQKELYGVAKEIGIPAKKAFEAIYLVLIGKTHGPKAAWFLLDLDRDFVIRRLQRVHNFSDKKTPKEYLYSAIDRPDLFSIDEQVGKRFPSITVGIAVIKGVRVEKKDRNLQEEINKFIEINSTLTTGKLGEHPEIRSYRRIYKEIGVDWHSRRPSPEALLRRIALGKGFNSVNTCVDAYNLIVMRYRVSAGAFDFDKLQFPTILRFAKTGEKIHLLGDGEPTVYTKGEIAYFDKEGGYNIDFNFRDSQRTRVTEHTENLWINVEGVYDITRGQVEKTLKETIEIIVKYCGGQVELAGIVTAK